MTVYELLVQSVTLAMENYEFVLIGFAIAAAVWIPILICTREY